MCGWRVGEGSICNQRKDEKLHVANETGMEEFYIRIIVFLFLAFFFFLSSLMGNQSPKIFT